jgi:hypothetical protein
MVPDQQAPVRHGVRDRLAPRAPVKPRFASTGGAAERTDGQLTGGGTAGNERLTAATGIILILLLATIGVTIVRIGSLLWVHLFVGLVLIPVLLLKLGSTGYRFVRYYTSNPAYRERGAPPLALRLLGPIVVATSVAVLATGMVLLFVGPKSGGVLRELHKLSFFLWVAFMAIHVLGHLPDLQKTFLTKRGERFEYNNLAAGRTGRTIALLGALVAGTVLAILLIPDFGAWTTHFGAFHHH